MSTYGAAEMVAFVGDAMGTVLWRTRRELPNKIRGFLKRWPIL